MCVWGGDTEQSYQDTVDKGSELMLNTMVVAMIIPNYSFYILPRTGRDGFKVP